MQSHGPFPDAESCSSAFVQFRLGCNNGRSKLRHLLFFSHPHPVPPAAYSCLQPPTISLGKLPLIILLPLNPKMSLSGRDLHLRLMPRSREENQERYVNLIASKKSPLTVLQSFYRCFTAKRPELGCSGEVGQSRFVAAQTSH
jgi:hypothetical protein